MSREELRAGGALPGWVEFANERIQQFDARRRSEKRWDAAETAMRRKHKATLRSCKHRWKSQPIEEAELLGTVEQPQAAWVRSCGPAIQPERPRSGHIQTQSDETDSDASVSRVSTELLQEGRLAAAMGADDESAQALRQPATQIRRTLRQSERNRLDSLRTKRVLASDHGRQVWRAGPEDDRAGRLEPAARGASSAR